MLFCLPRLRPSRAVASSPPCVRARSPPVLLCAKPTTATAPQIKSRRRSRWPILDVAPSRVLPPDDFCLGVSPSQAAKSRPLPKLSAVGASASSAVAQITPMPGIVIRRFAVSSCRARARKSLSSKPICSQSEAMCVSSILQSPITARGRRSSEPLTAPLVAQCGRVHSGRRPRIPTYVRVAH